MSRNIIAIVGLPGAGKTVVIDYLMEKHKWPKVYFGDVTFDEMKSRGLEINEKNERATREDLRAKYGLLHYANKVVEKIGKIKNSETILVESLYSWEEYLLFKKDFGLDFKVIAVYTSPKVRYERLASRKVRPLTPEEAESRDYAQIVNITQAGPISMANYTVDNNGSFDSLYSQIDKIITELQAK
jgi:dephospho-CoA kinase